VAETAAEFAGREYEYLRRQEGREFFLALAPYANALHGKRRIKRALEGIESETRAALQRYVDEYNGFIAEAKEIRNELARRAPEIDNSDMERPDIGSHLRLRYDLDSFASFDEQADADTQIGYSLMPGANDDPGPMRNLIPILRGRLRAAQFGEDADPNADPIREDLGDIGRRINNLAERHDHAVRRYRQEAHTLPGMAFARLVYFGSELNPDPVVIETDADVEQWLDKTLREWGRPKTLVRQFVNGEHLGSSEHEYVGEIEQSLKHEADRLHQELARRLPPRFDFARQNAAVFGIGVATTVVAGVILRYGFGIG
jgi:hypothetical protein